MISLEKQKGNCDLDKPHFCNKLTGIDPETVRPEAGAVSLATGPKLPVRK
jgi:hypothetical protein